MKSALKAAWIHFVVTVQLLRYVKGQMTCCFYVAVTVTHAIQLNICGVST
jgi:hypothetical protein